MSAADKIRMEDVFTHEELVALAGQMMRETDEELRKYIVFGWAAAAAYNRKDEVIAQAEAQIRADRVARLAETTTTGWGDPTGLIQDAGLLPDDEPGAAS